MDLLLLFALIFFIMWICGFAFSVGGSMIHFLLVIVVFIILIRLLQGRPV